MMRAILGSAIGGLVAGAVALVATAQGRAAGGRVAECGADQFAVCDDRRGYARDEFRVHDVADARPVRAAPGSGAPAIARGQS